MAETPRKKAPAKKAPAKRKAPAKKRTTTRKARAIIKDIDDTMAPGDRFPWEPRPYQVEARKAFLDGRRYQMLAWHRRAGKDIHGLNMARDEARQRVGGYIHFFPKQVQARRALWNGVDPKKGANFIDAAFGDIEASRNGTDMMVELYNGSTWQLLGSDNYDRIVGSNAVGVVFSEWALCDPRAWDFIRPMILENKGWALFISTFRGRNHMWQMTERLRDNPEWYVDVRPITKTVDIHGKPILTEEDIQRERDSGMSEALIQQEYYCNPAAAAEGAIYGAETTRLRDNVYFRTGTWNPAAPVYAVWNFDVPIYASRILVQPGTSNRPPVILSAETFREVSAADALAAGTVCEWPIQGHIIHERNRDMTGRMADLGCRPHVVRDRGLYLTTQYTSDMLVRCVIDPARVEVLLDSLAGYVRAERFNAQAAGMEFSETPLVSWHSELVRCLETWSVWEYHSQQSSNWSKPLDQTALDSVSRIRR